MESVKEGRFVFTLVPTISELRHCPDALQFSSTSTLLVHAGSQNFFLAPGAGKGMVIRWCAMDDEFLRRAKQLLADEAKVSSQLSIHSEQHRLAELKAQAQGGLSSVGSLSPEMLAQIKGTVGAQAAMDSLDLSLSQRWKIADELVGRIQVNKPFAQDYTVSEMAKHQAMYKSLFSVPNREQTDQLLASLAGKIRGTVYEHFQAKMPGIEQYAMAMHAPWINSLNTVGSMRGFAEMQAKAMRLQNFLVRVLTLRLI